MTTAVTLLGFAAAVVVLSGMARRFGVSAPLLLTVVGILVGTLPFVPAVEVEPELVLLGLLPPLLYSAAIKTSLLDLRANLRTISLLSVGLVVFTAVAVAVVVWRLLDIPFALALAIGGVVAPPDAVAATAVANRIGLPRRMVTILEGESLFNDATALVIVRMGLLAVGTAVSATQVGLTFVWAAGAGIGIGVLVGVVIGRIRTRITETVTDTALSFMLPWLAYLPAEAVHASGVLSVVVAGVLLGHRAPVIQTAQSRMAERINWTTVQYLLENAVFLLIGLEAWGIVEAARSSGISVPRLVVICLATLAVVLLARPVWVFGSGLLSAGHGTQTKSARERLRAGTVISWAGMRGVVTLAAAFTIPADTVYRDVLVLIALVVTAGTLLLQGFSLPWVARKLDVHGPDPREDALQQAMLTQRVVAAGEGRLEQALGSGEVEDDTMTREVAANLRAQADRRRNAAWERLGRSEDEASTPGSIYRTLRADMLSAERDELLRIRSTGEVPTEILGETMTSLDLEESMIVTLDERESHRRERMLLTPEPQAGDCEHLREAPRGTEPRTPEGCETCLATGEQWVHLRLCLQCGYVGCCDSSPGRHASAHFRETAHPVMRSLEPGEAWRWCFVDDLLG